MTEVFSSDDQLRLLQLLTRRAMSERIRRVEQSEEADSDGKENTDVVASTEVIPENWRLIPEGISLYDWQQECLPLWFAGGHGTVKVATGGKKTTFRFSRSPKASERTRPQFTVGSSGAYSAAIVSMVR